MQLLVLNGRAEDLERDDVNIKETLRGSAIKLVKPQGRE
ncbi:hypothetical protein HDC32_000503 [Pseudomonas sp. JAI120]|nr:hypothetical protein [Pseudomonas sp. SJZ073]MBB6310834.1 hypothetical protein [Pseudomonas sp. JAI120]